MRVDSWRSRAGLTIGSLFAVTVLAACSNREAEGTGQVALGLRWTPAADSTFYWELMNAPPTRTENVGAVDMDGLDNDASTVAALHAAGKKAVCYIDVGTWEDWRDDRDDFPPARLGNYLDAPFNTERWLDVRPLPSDPDYLKIQSIMTARFTQCRDKGFDAVEPDNMDSAYQGGPVGGWTISPEQQLAYNIWVADTVHGLGLAVFQKNDLNQTADLVSHFDGILNEECHRFSGDCDYLAPYLAAHKPVWNAEYSDFGQTTGSFCSQDVASGIIGALFNQDLDGTVFQPCPNDVGIKN